MSNDSFHFKRFTICHDRCAMKVGTDGVLLGAWGSVEGHCILDIGTGTGLIALMAAQRNPDATVLGIDIDETAVQQAQENIKRSPFCDRVNCQLQDVLTFHPKTPFDAILCNPPFFTEDTLPDDKGRAMARNNRSLPFSSLIRKAASLLTDKGRLSLIVPSTHAQEIVGLCLAEGLYLNRRCIVRTKASKPPRRTLMMFSSCASQTTEEQDLCLTTADGSRSASYIRLTEEFYL